MDDYLNLALEDLTSTDKLLLIIIFYLTLLIGKQIVDELMNIFRGL